MVAHALLSEEIATLQQLRIKRAQSGLLNFTCFTKEDYEVNWHHRTMCRYLNKVAKGEITRLMINVQPRAGKSELVSRRFPAFYLGLNPSHQIVAASYSATLAQRMNRDVQRIMDSDKYRQIFPETRLSSQSIRSTAQGNWLRNSDEFEVVGTGGLYRAAGVGGATTGYGAHLAVIDDPVKNRDDASSQRYRDRVWDWYTSTLFTRLEKSGKIILCMTRWSDDDLAGRLLSRAKKNPNADQWTVLSLPSIHEGVFQEGDPRKEGEALWPNKYSLKRLRAMRETMGERDWVSLYMQRPAPLEGGLIKNSWWRYWTELPSNIDMLVASADLSFNNDTGREDFAVFTVWARAGTNFYLLDMVRNRMNWLQQKSTMLRLVEQYPDLNAFYIENAALGAALVAEARLVIPGVIPVTPRGGKASRLEAVSGLIEAGNVWLPDPETTGIKIAEAVVTEMAVFPNGANDDIVDSCSMALSQMRRNTSSFVFNDLGLEKESSLTGLRDV